MNETIQFAKKYFELSNQGNLEEIAKMFSEASTYISLNTGIYLGTDKIMKMMFDFHSSFKSLHWNIDSIRELNPGIAEINFTFNGIKQDGANIQKTGIEYVTIVNNIITYIEIKNRE